MTTDYEELVRRAKGGEISREEVDAVATELQKPDPSASRYTLLYIVGRSFTTSYRDLVEQFLEYRDDPMLARLALQILCHFWGDTAQYKRHVLRFLRRVDFDVENDCRSMAISVAGEYLRENPEPEFLGELIRIYEEPDEPESSDEDDYQASVRRLETELIRYDAYCALARAVGYDYRDIPSSLGSFDSAEDPRSVLQKAKERLQREKGLPQS
jgi:hypothetical protein